MIGGVNGTISGGALTGSLPAIDGSALTGITATTLNGQAASHYLDFANFTNTPTTLAGYGITDGLQLGTSATTALAGNTALFSGAFADLTSKPTTLAGYGITDAATLNNMAPTGAVDFTGAILLVVVVIVVLDSNPSTPPTSGQVLKWSGTQWAPADDITSGGGGLNADTLDGFDSTYYLNFNNLTNKPTYGQNDLNDTTIGGNLATGHLLQYNGTAWNRLAILSSTLSFVKYFLLPSTISSVVVGIVGLPVRSA